MNEKSNDEKRLIAEQALRDIDWLTINGEMKYLWGQFFAISEGMPAGDTKKRLGGSLKSLEKARINIEARGEELTARQRANFALLRIRYGKYVENDTT